MCITKLRKLKLQFFATSCEALTHWKRPDAGRDWGQEEKGTTEDEMAAWHHWLDEHEFGWTPGVGDGQAGLVCWDSWGRKESDTTERMNWIECAKATSYIIPTISLYVKGNTVEIVKRSVVSRSCVEERTNTRSTEDS